MFKAKAGWVRVFDFPRAQLFVAGTLVLLARALVQREGRRDRLNRPLVAGVAAALGTQFLQIRPYTRLARKQVARKPASSGAALRLLTANVRMRNRSTAELRDLVAETQPDVILLLEPDRWWLDRLAFEKVYSHHVEHPLPNTYGIALYSKFPLRNPEVRFLVQQDVPSIRAGIRLPNGSGLRFYGVHPRPPARWAPNQELTWHGTGSRDAELILIAREIRECPDPVIVAGDFNDVAWSHTTRRFQRIGRLLDPRVGRGLYNTFHARHPLLRFPLDHLFHSEHFALVDFRRLPDIGSDHFPILVTLAMTPDAPARQEAPPAQVADFREASKDIAAARQDELL